MLLVPMLAQTAPADSVAPSFAAAAGLAGLITAAVCIPLFLWLATRRWSLAALLVLFVGQLALISASSSVEQAYSDFGASGWPWLVVVVVGLIPPVALMLWRRTRRLGLACLGLTVIPAVLVLNYWGAVMASIGYLLLLLALWPRWRLLRGAPRGRDIAPAIPSRGIFIVRPWPIDARPSERGFTLVSALVGVTCLTIAFGLTAQVIGGTTSALRRAGRLATATDLLESARERALAGADPGDLGILAAASLPHGEGSLQRAPAGPGLARVTAAVTWREPGGRSGRATLEWLTAEARR